MKLLYFGCLCFLILLMIFFMGVAFRKKYRYSTAAIHMLMFTMLGMAFYARFLMSTNRYQAALYNSLYFASLEWMAFFLLYFVMLYSDMKSVWNKGKVPLIALTIAASGAMLCNNIADWMFEVEAVALGGMEEYYIIHYHRFIWMHIGLCYMLLLDAAVILLYKALTEIKLFKAKYLTILIPFILAISMNFVGDIKNYRVDVTIGCYGVLAVIIASYAFWILPKNVAYTAQKAIADHINQGMIFFDSRNRCIYANEVIQKGFNLVSAEKLEKNPVEYFIDWHRSFEEKNQDEAEWKDHFEGTKGGSTCLNLTYRKLKDRSGADAGYFFVVEDQTEEMVLYEGERYRAMHDTLTGLYNRENFFSEADKKIKEDPDRPRFMVASDVKDFKLVNNLFGEECGDKILKLQAELVKKYMTENTICGRISGDKFAMLIDKDCFDRAVFEKSVREINNYINDKKFIVHYHIGIYDVTGIREKSQVLYNRVNMAIATIHDDYERIFVEYDQEMMNTLLNEKKLVTDFDTALAERQFKMFLQPQISSGGKLVGAEALVRWQHPEKGMIYPDQFIGVFEKTSLIHKMDLDIWNQAAEKLAEWKKVGKDKIHISINISSKDFYYLDVYEELVKIVKKNQIDPANLKLEITESAVLADRAKGFATTRKLKEYGFDLELDDFGSGYSSLNMLKDFNVDVLKIDRMFLRETVNVEKSRIILDSVITMAKKLGMVIVTEGVEEKNQVECLSQMGCDIFQGYYFDKPITVEQFEKKYMEK